MRRAFVLALLAALLASGCTAKPETGRPAPNLELVDVDGQSLRLADWFGEPILLEVFGVQCGSCQAMMSQLVPFHDAYGDRVRMLSVDLGARFDQLGAENEDQVRGWRERYHANWTFALDAADHRTNDAYPHTARPTMYLIDRAARIGRIYEGWTPLEMLRADADFVLAEGRA
jgi:peroxiredoxin